jgi:hypothetical protein
MTPTRDLAHEQRIAAAGLLRGACEYARIDWKGRVKVPVDVLRKVLAALERRDD